MRRRTNAKRGACAVLTLAVSFCGWAETTPPLKVPAAPEAEIRGTPGNRTIYYWAWAADANGHSAYSRATAVTNAPNELSDANAVMLTPAPVSNATQYAILTSRAGAPAALSIDVRAKGDQTFYYWMQGRNGRTVWSPLTGPFKAEGCSLNPSNLLSWSASAASEYFIYRTATPSPPIGYRSCLVGDRWTRTNFLDRFTMPVTRLVEPAGNAAEKPQGVGPYLVGVSAGDPIEDHGQKLTEILAYDMNTTDPACRPFSPQVKAYTPGANTSPFDFRYHNRLVGPRESWDHFEGISVNQFNEAGGVNWYPNYGTGIERGTGKNSHIGVGIHQLNYTSSQKAGLLEYIHNFGNGDCCAQVVSLSTSGQVRSGGDEGAEFFSYHMGRGLTRDLTRLLADAPRGDTSLKVEKPGNVCADRGIVNLSKAYRAGMARVDGVQQSENFQSRIRGTNVCAVGTGTDWTSDMEGWAISFDADTRSDGIRQWYRVDRFISPTRLKIFAYTYYSGSGNCYLGNAITNGLYLLCPYTEMKEGTAAAGSIRVVPLTCDWAKDDAVEVIAGPQTTFRLGWWEMNGNMMPQDHVGGLGIMYYGDKDAGEGALNIMGRWPAAVEAHNTKAGMILDDVGIGLVFRTNSPVVLRMANDDLSPIYQLAGTTNGLFLDAGDGRDGHIVGLTQSGLRLDKGTLAGNDRTRGRAVFSGDGKTTEFVVKFSKSFPAAPFVVASSGLRIGMGIERYDTDGFTAAFASPPPVGKENVAITWMAQE